MYIGDFQHRCMRNGEKCQQKMDLSICPCTVLCVVLHSALLVAVWIPLTCVFYLSRLSKINLLYIHIYNLDMPTD